ncbi:MAG: PIN domain-containing protein [Nitrososphaerales archaeon]
MGRVSYFIDTYAMIEYLSGNKRYSKYLDAELHTSKLNLMELYFLMLREHGEDMAERAYATFRVLETSFNDEDVKESMKMRLRLKAGKTHLSYADALGYQLAKRLGAKFLTGDDAFKRLANVEFVK